MDWYYLLIFCIGLYVGSNIPKAWEQWKAGTAVIRERYRKEVKV